MTLKLRSFFLFQFRLSLRSVTDWSSRLDLYLRRTAVSAGERDLISERNPISERAAISAWRWRCRALLHHTLRTDRAALQHNVAVVAARHGVVYNHRGDETYGFQAVSAALPSSRSLRCTRSRTLLCHWQQISRVCFSITHFFIFFLMLVHKLRPYWISQQVSPCRKSRLVFSAFLCVNKILSKQSDRSQSNLLGTEEPTWMWH